MLYLSRSKVLCWAWFGRLTSVMRCNFPLMVEIAAFICPLMVKFLVHLTFETLTMIHEERKFSYLSTDG